jgi:hypothetical protein
MSESIFSAVGKETTSAFGLPINPSVIFLPSGESAGIVFPGVNIFSCSALAASSGDHRSFSVY